MKNIDTPQKEHKYSFISLPSLKMGFYTTYPTTEYWSENRARLIWLVQPSKVSFTFPSSSELTNLNIGYIIFI